MKALLTLCLGLFFGFQFVFAEQLDFFTDSQVYAPTKPLFVYGKALPNEDVILRFTGPDQNVIAFTQITASKDGQFQTELFTWPDVSTTIPYGTYVVEVI